MFTNFSIVAAMLRILAKLNITLWWQCLNIWELKMIQGNDDPNIKEHRFILHSLTRF